MPRDDSDAFQRPPQLREWRLKRNCSLTPGQSAIAYGALCLLICAVALVCAIHGAWMVMAFASFNLIGLGWGLLHYARHATDCERIALTDSTLLIERTEGGREQQFVLQPAFTRISLPTGRRSLLVLESGGREVAVGSFVSESMRQQVGMELRLALRGASAHRTDAP